MPKYDVHVTCSECSQMHFVNVRLDLDENGLDRKTLAEYFADRPIPSQIAFMQTNNYRCPHTKQLYSAADLSGAILFDSNK